MKAYVAHGEKAQLVCAFDKSPARALKKIAKMVQKMDEDDQFFMLGSINVSYDEDGYYALTATVSTSGS